MTPLLSQRLHEISSPPRKSFLFNTKAKNTRLHRLTFSAILFRKQASGGDFHPQHRHHTRPFVGTADPAAINWLIFTGSAYTAPPGQFTLTIWLEDFTPDAAPNRSIVTLSAGSCALKSTLFSINYTGYIDNVIASAGGDKIIGFTTPEDHLNLKAIAAGQTYLHSNPSDGHASQVRYDAATGILQGDVNRDSVADYEINLGVGAVLAAGDLIL